MKGVLIGIVAFFTIILVIGGGVFMSYVSAYNTAVRYEASIEKYDKSSQNTLSSYTLKLKEAAKVPDKYVDGLKDVIKATFEGRYGQDGSKAAFQWIKEQNIPLDQSVYLKLQTIIDAGRDEFKLSQDRKLEVCSQYEIVRNQFWRGMLIQLAGYPKKDLSTLCRIIVDQSTQDKFKSGTDAIIDF